MPTSDSRVGCRRKDSATLPEHLNYSLSGNVTFEGKENGDLLIYELAESSSGGTNMGEHDGVC